MLLTADSTWAQLRDLSAPVAIFISSISNQGKRFLQRVGDTKGSIILPLLSRYPITFTYETETAQSIEIKFYDLEGKQPYAEHKLFNQLIRWSATELAAGLCYLSVYNDNQRTIKKLVKL